MEQTEWGKLRFEHCWRHFQFFATRRANNFHYCVAISAALYVLVAVSVQYSMPALTMWSCGLGVVSTAIFWSLDRRFRFLLKYSEAALKEMEGNQIMVPGVFFADIFTKTDAVKGVYAYYGEAQTLFFLLNIVAMAVLGFGGHFGLFQLIGV